MSSVVTVGWVTQVIFWNIQIWESSGQVGMGFMAHPLGVLPQNLKPINKNEQIEDGVMGAQPNFLIKTYGTTGSSNRELILKHMIHE